MANSKPERDGRKPEPEPHLDRDPASSTVDDSGEGRRRARRSAAEMAPPDPMTATMTPEGIAHIAADELEEVLGEDEKAGRVDDESLPPNPHRPHQD
jgi:hypothetical protein